MSNLSLRLPESLHEKVRKLAQEDDVSINQFIATAVAEKTATLMTVAYMEERAREGSPELFDRLLSRVPDVPPIPGDELPQPVRRHKAPQASRLGSKRKSRKSS